VERAEDMRDADKAEEEEDLGEVEGKFFTIISEYQDITCRNVRGRHACHDGILLILTT